MLPISREEWTEVALMGSAAVEPLIRALNDDDGGGAPRGRQPSGRSW